MHTYTSNNISYCQVVSLFAYLTGSWRRYLLTVNATCLPVLLLMLAWVESPRWLIQQKRYDDALCSIHTMCKWNGVKIRFKTSDLQNIKAQSDAQRT